jgi:hypothetical protein
MLKRKTQLHVSARGHLQVGSFSIFREKNAFGNVLLICNDEEYPAFEDGPDRGFRNVGKT